MTIILILLLLPQIIFGLTDSNNVVEAQFESPKSDNELKFEYYGKGEAVEKKITGGIEECSKIKQTEKIESGAVWIPPKNKEIKEIEAGSESEGRGAAHEVAKIEPRAICPPKNEEIEEKEEQQEIKIQAFCSSQVKKCFKYKLSNDPFGKTCEQHCVENISCTSFAIRTAVNGKKLEKGNFCFLAIDKCPKGFMPFYTETKRGLEECENSTFAITPMKPRTKMAKVLEFTRFIGQSLWAINMWTAKKIALPLVKSSSLGVINFTMMFPHLAIPLWIFMYFIGWKICFKIATKMFWFLWNYGGLIATWIWNNPRLALVGFAVIGSGAYVYFPTLLSLLQAFGSFMMKALEFLKDLLGKHAKELGEEYRKLTGEKAIDCLPQSCVYDGVCNEIKMKNANLSGVVNELQLQNANLTQQMKALETTSKELAKNLMGLKLENDLPKTKIDRGTIFHILGRLLGSIKL